MSLPGEEYFTVLMDENLQMHADALAIQLPRKESFETEPVVVMPLYRHGDPARPTTWYWLTLPPESEIAKTLGLQAGIGILVFLAGFSLVRSQRKS